MDAPASETARNVVALDEVVEEKELRGNSGDFSASEKGLEVTSISSADGSIRKVDSHVVRVKAVKEGDAAFEHLPEDERAVLKRQLDIPAVNVTYLMLYRYATRNDLFIVALSAICAIIAGAVMPLMTVIFGGLTGSFSAYLTPGSTVSRDDFNSTLARYTLYFVYLGIGEFITIYIATLGFLYTGEHITQKIREQYLAAILRQNIGFFDKLGAGEMTTRITSDTNLVQDGISEKVSLTLTAMATFITAFIIGFIRFWKLTLILSSTIFAIAAIMGAGSSFMIKYNKRSLEAYAFGGTVAEEVVSSIRNAVAFGTQDKLAKQYEKHTREASIWGLKHKIVLAFLLAAMFCILFLTYGLAFWQGSKFIVDGETTVSAIITVMMAIVIGAFSLGGVAPNAQAFGTAIAAAGKIYNTIDRISPLDPKSDAGAKLEHVDGNIELRNIKHIYPSRAEVVVMENVNLTVPAGRTTALVGASGSGKSTIVGLVERFYDPVQGSVYLDGHDVRELNLRWLRQQLALVSQEPTLFGTTIYENIRHGLIGTPHDNADPEKQKELILDAAKMANAHDFIQTLPEKYETNVGERGFLLSGGQKQRIAIARAMVSNPKILLLDEATSALDTKSEGVVQAALDVAAKGRTTIIIAHRLSTIRTADKIVVMSRGKIVEQGAHDELLEQRGAYYNLVEAQKISESNKDESGVGTDKDLEVEVKLDRIATGKSVQSYQADPDDENIQRKLEKSTTSQSKSSEVLKKAGIEKEKRYGLWTLIKLTAAFNRGELWLMLCGLFWSVIAGGANPTQSVFFAFVLTSLSKPPSQYGELLDAASFWSKMYLMLAIVVLIAHIAQGVAFAFCSERLIARVRDRAFRTILRQDITFFDKDENSAGALTSFLSTQTTYVAGISGTTLGTILVTATTLIASIVVSLAIGWKLALVCVSTIPIVLGCGFCRFYMLGRFQARAKKSYESSASYACEATSAIRTVASLTREDDVWDAYHQSLTAQGQRSLRSVSKSTILYAGSQSFMFLCIALGFWYGGTLISTLEYSIFQFFVCFSSVIFGAQSAGTVFSFAPDMGKAKQAAQELKTLFERKPVIDTWSEEGDKLDTMEGTIEFRDVHFRYPTRPEQPVLRGLNLQVKPGQYCALVGQSGCGKSTTIQLLERFYDPLAGSVLVDGKDVSRYRVNDYRKHIALVSQEPTLYQGTIRENILLGSTVEDHLVPEDAIIQATKSANIYEFIMSLPDGFSTIVGTKGSMLSGGQKQRIAIARALIRDPKILLLDEATSALDSQSEKVVQAALDAAALGRTTIAIAHRLSTIQNADIIYVFDQGVIVEEGTHSELLDMKGKYFELVNLQSLGKVH